MRRTEAPATLAEAIRRGITRALVITLSLAVGYVTMSTLVTMTRSAEAPGSAEVMDIREHAEHSPAWATERAERRGLECWNGPAPKRYAEAVPTHVIWQHADGRTVVSSRLVGPALDTLFADGTLDGQAIAFCHTTR